MLQRNIKLKSIPLQKVGVVSKSDKIPMMFYELKRTRLDRVIVKDGEKLVGVVTLRDIFTKLASKKFSNISPKSLSIASFMSENLVYVSENGTIEDVIKIMIEKNVSGLPVLDSKNNVLGMITKNYILNLLSNELKGIVIDYAIRTGYRILGGTSLATLSNEILKNVDMREFVVVQDNRPLGVVGEKELAIFLFNYLSDDNIMNMKNALQNYVVNDILTFVNETLKPNDTIQYAAKLFSNTNLVIYPITKDDILFGVIRRRELFNQLYR
ncbi:MAG: CBS domain-containing protein [Nitrososphaeria archaeon]